MGREARVRKPRQLKGSERVVYATAEEAKDESQMLDRAQRAGLILPGIELPGGRNDRDD